MCKNTGFFKREKSKPLKSQTSLWRNFVFLLKLVWSADRVGLLWALVPVVFTGLNQAVNISSLKWIIDAIALRKTADFVLILILGMAAIQQLSAFVTARVQVRIQIMDKRISKTVNQRLLSRVLEIDAENYDDPQFYDKLNKSAQEVGRVSGLVLFIQNTLNLGVQFVVALGFIVTLEPLLLSVCILVGIVTAIMAIKLNGINRKYYDEYMPIMRITQYFHSLFFKREAVTDIKQFGKLGFLFSSRWTKAFKQLMNVQIKQVNVQANTRVILGAIMSIASGTIPTIYAGLKALRGVISIADMTVTINAAQQVATTVGGLAQAISSIHEHTMYADYLRNIFDYKPNIEILGGEQLDRIERVEFENVTFQYPNSDALVLHNINFIVTRGQKLALVGINGAGKTTIVKLIMRFYDPTSGVIKINNKDIRYYDIGSLRASIASIFQETQAYSITIRELISCSHDNDNTGRIVEVLKQVGMYEKISEIGGLDSEYSKYFDKSGGIFSGGQLQKLMIARMLFKNGDLLIMDEPSSALDPESEYEINHELLSAAFNKTLIMISHRLSTTRDADKIVFIENGEITEQGNHNELMKMGGRYSSLFTLQSKQYDIPNYVSTYV